MKSKLADLRVLLESKNYIPAQVFELIGEIERESEYRYEPDALNLITRSIHAVEAEFGPNDPAIAQLRRILRRLNARKVAA
jgi:hypothetical protein